MGGSGGARAEQLQTDKHKIRSLSNCQTHAYANTLLAVNQKSRLNVIQRLSVCLVSGTTKLTERLRQMRVEAAGGSASRRVTVTARVERGQQTA